MAAKNPGVPVLAMNPARKERKKRKMAKRKKRTSTTRRRKSNPGNPRRRVTHRRRRRHNPGNPGGMGAIKSIGLMLLGAAGALALKYGLAQTSLEPKTAAMIEGGVGLVGGGALAYFVSPEVGGGLASTGAVLGAVDYMGAPGGTKPAPSKLRQRVLKPGSLKQLRGLYDDDEGLEALGAVVAALGELDDDSDEGFFEGLGEAGDDDDDDDGEGMGAVTTELGEAGDDDDDDDGEGMGAVEEEALFS